MTTALLGEYSRFRFIGSPINWGSCFIGPLLDSRNNSYSNAYKCLQLFGHGFQFLSQNLCILSCATTCTVEMVKRQDLSLSEKVIFLDEITL